jgi:hypothetical protein
MGRAAIDGGAVDRGKLFSQLGFDCAFSGRPDPCRMELLSEAVHARRRTWRTAHHHQEPE